MQSQVLSSLVTEKLATKEDLVLLKNELKAEIASSQEEAKTDIMALRAEIKADISALKIDIIKWAIGLLLGQSVFILSVILSVFKLH